MSKNPLILKYQREIMRAKNVGSYNDFRDEDNSIKDLLLAIGVSTSFEINDMLMEPSHLKRFDLSMIIDSRLSPITMDPIFAFRPGQPLILFKNEK